MRILGRIVGVRSTERISPWRMLTLYMDEMQHYDLAIRTGAEGCEAVLKINIGTAKHTLAVFSLTENCTGLLVTADPLEYHFYLIGENTAVFTGFRCEYL